MSESETQTPDTEGTKIYPGNIDRYRGLRNLRAATPIYGSDKDKENGVVNPQHVGLCIAEELAGLAYILDGIRYSARNK